MVLGSPPDYSEDSEDSEEHDVRNIVRVDQKATLTISALCHSATLCDIIFILHITKNIFNLYMYLFIKLDLIQFQTEENGG